MLSYLIVGSGYRSEYFARVATTHPALFRAMFLCRSPEKAALKRKNTGVPATTSLGEALAFGPDFVVVAVDRPHVAAVAEEWAGRGFPVVTETPVGASGEDLARLRALAEGGTVFADIDQIVYIETYNRGCLVHTTAKTYEDNKTIGDYEKRLTDSRFMRIHKSFIINLEYLYEMMPWSARSVVVKMKGYEKSLLPVGREKVGELKHRLNAP